MKLGPLVSMSPLSDSVTFIFVVQCVLYPSEVVLIRTKTGCQMPYMPGCRRRSPTYGLEMPKFTSVLGRSFGHHKLSLWDVSIPRGKDMRVGLCGKKVRPW